MRLLVLGASGGCGRWLVRLAAERGHRVTALVRDGSDAAAPAGVVVRRGDAADAATLDAALAALAALAGAGGAADDLAVLSCLGLRRAGRSPWAPLRSPPDLTARVTRLLLPAMHRHGVRRVVALSAAGVGDSLAHCSWPVRRLVAAGNVGVAYRDLAAMEAALAASDAAWIVARPVTLVDGARTGGARQVARYGLTSTIRRADVAAWMLAAAEQPAGSAGRQVMIAG
jgi:uncharacterized protein YbjT (DUF2867 family)